MGFTRFETEQLQNQEQLLKELKYLRRSLDILTEAIKKEQEPAQVIQREAANMLFWCCGSCGVAITDGDKFCRMCGKKVKWE